MDRCRKAGEVWERDKGVVEEEKRDKTWSNTDMLPVLTRSKASKQFPPCLLFVLNEIWATLALRPISRGWWLPFLMGASNRAALSTFLVPSEKHKVQDWKCTGSVLSTVSQALTRG